MHKKLSGFTLIELIITVSISFIILTVIVLDLDPDEFVSQTRDAQRISDLKRIDTAIYLAKNSPNESLEDNSSSDIVYVSLPDKNGILTDDCMASGEYPDLPALSGAWQYRCASVAERLHYTDGNGWIPINFDSVSGNPLMKLPIDPVNDEINYYTFSRPASNPGNLSLSAPIQSEKYLKEAENDGGNGGLIFETKPAGWAGVSEGVGWEVNSNPSGGSDGAEFIAIDSAFAYVVGHDYSLGNNQWRIEKRNLSDGGLVWAKTSNPGSGYDMPYSIAIDSSYAYIVGRDSSLGVNNSQWRIEKRNLSDGNLVWVMASNLSTRDDVAYSIAIDSSYAYITGWDGSPGVNNNQWRIEKRNLSDGGLVWAKTSDPSSGRDGSYSIVIDSSYAYIVGDENYSQWRIEKRNLSDGNLVWENNSDPSIGSDIAYSVAVDSSYVYITGEDESLGTDNQQWRIEKRNLSDGGLVWAKVYNPGDGWDTPTSITIDPLYAYIVGWDTFWGINDEQWRIEKRNLSDGNLVWVMTSNPSSSGESPYSVAVGSSYIYIVGDDDVLGNDQWKIEKRKKLDGGF
jgi:hypothetical protein